MTPSARVQAAIELLDEIILAARDQGPAADTLIARYFKTRRYAGSKDRRAVRELVYRAVRRSGERPESGRAAMLGLAREDREIAALFDGSAHGPAPIAAGEPAAQASALPEWLAEKIEPADAAALLARAPLDLRVNSLKADREAVLARLGGEPTRLSPLGVRFAEPFAVEAHPLWAWGAIEVQDEGSQLVALACRAAPGMTVVDLCAGAGGKTLALAAEMRGEGRLIACDTNRDRLSRLAPRAERAGAGNIEVRLLDPGKELEAFGEVKADIVLVDAPCSGSGTWRRNPEARWRLTPARLAKLVETQRNVLDVGSSLLRPGGILVYAVCSLIDEEGAGQIDALLSTRSGWMPETALEGIGDAAGAGTRLSPARHGTDGFFVARLRSP